LPLLTRIDACSAMSEAQRQYAARQRVDRVPHTVEGKMSERTDRFCDEMRLKLEQLDEGLDELKTNLTGALHEAEDEADAKREELRARLEASRQKAESLRNTVDARSAEFKASIKGKIAEWKAGRKRDQLEARAADAADRAAAAFFLAVRAIQEAEVAVLDAVAASRDVDAAETKAA
jgi:hypothetical protein